MVIVADETIGWTEEAGKHVLHTAELKVKPVAADKNGEPLSQVLKERRTSFLNRKLKIQPGDLHDHVKYFKDIVHYNERSITQICYIYDPAVTDTAHLLRVRNWLKPEVDLVPVSIRPSSAFIDTYLLLIFLEKTGGRLDIRKNAENLIHTSGLWLISPFKKYSAFSKKRFVVSALKEYEQFYLHYFNPDERKWAVQAKGTVGDLLDQMYEQFDPGLPVYGSRKHVTQEINNISGMADMPPQSLPVTIPYMHFIQAKQPLTVNDTNLQQQTELKTDD